MRDATIPQLNTCFLYSPRLARPRTRTGASRTGDSNSVRFRWPPSRGTKLLRQLRNQTVRKILRFVKRLDQGPLVAAMRADIVEIEKHARRTIRGNPREPQKLAVARAGVHRGYHRRSWPQLLSQSLNHGEQFRI